MERWHFFCSDFFMIKHKRKIYLFIALILNITLGCNFSDRSDGLVNEAKNSIASTIPTGANDTIYAGDRDTIILLKDGEAIIKGSISANKTNAKYTVPVWQGQTVMAILTPLEKVANIRIHQVQKPGGAFDGPFGDRIQHTIETNGNLRYIIGDSVKEAAPYKGDFILHIQVK